MGSRRRIESSNYRNPCLTMHQPWASLLVHGIKRIEGRSWPAPIRGRLWIHAAGKVPEPETIKLMEDFYREIYAMNGVTDIKFPDHYPVSRLLGCVNVVGCVTCEELVSWEAVPTSVRVEGQTALCWLCEQPQKLIVPFEMRGYQGVYNLERKIYEAAIRGLAPVKAPQPVSFLLPNPRDPFSLKPGSLASSSNCSSAKEEKPPSLVAAIAGAKEAATQFSRNVNPIGREAENLRPVEATTQFSRNGALETPIGIGSGVAENGRLGEAATQSSRRRNGTPIGRGAAWVIENHLRSARESWGKPTKS